jgi:hypothetical protein
LFVPEIRNRFLEVSAVKRFVTFPMPRRDETAVSGGSTSVVGGEGTIQTH